MPQSAEKALFTKKKDICFAFSPHKQRVSGAFNKKIVNNQDINDFINHLEVTPDEGWGAIACKSYTNPVI